MTVIDAQVHAWDRDSADFPWDKSFDRSVRSGSADPEADPITADRVIGMMDAVGVDAALLTPPLIYGSDLSYATYAVERFPNRFRIVARFDPDNPDVGSRIEALAENAAVIAGRVVVLPDTDGFLGSEGCRRIFSVSEQLSLPMCIWVVASRLRDLEVIAKRYPELLIIVDHLGMRGMKNVSERLQHLPNLLSLARYGNVAVKCSAVPSLSTGEYPFTDLWPHLLQVLDAFGVGRVMWGSDITQHTDRHNYAQAVDFIRLSNKLSRSEKEQILGGSFLELFDWKVAQSQSRPL